TSDAAVATVSSSGLVTAVADGTATGTATSGALTATATVTVAQVAAGISLSESALTFASLADTTHLTATVTDASGETISGATVTWTTSDAAVATVSSTGLVTSVADGTATVTATSGALTATASVTVAQAFYLATNGVTVTCSVADVGQTGEVNNVVYAKRSRAEIDVLVDAANYLALATTCTSDVTDMSSMFRNATAFNQDIGSWDVSSVTSMQSMFSNAWVFNQDIGSWDVSSVTSMSYMFNFATAFNQDLKGWCVSNITSKPSNFDIGATSWVLPRPVWGTCP
ncbi:MAG: BspA family leucine-rich repeat surface protein, partial [Gemmatimonadetes bacterium]|nr:BspA family leucine-rich repeat surface protein [Gemmatimonadota bacterium]